MKWKKRVTVLLAILMVFAVSSVVYGHDVPDLEKEGSITVSMTYSERPVSGGTLTLYRVGDVVSDDGDYSFVLSEEFAGSRLSLDDIQSDQLAKQLASYAKENRLDGVTGSIGSSGKILFQKVKPGLYLLVQSQAAIWRRIPSWSACPCRRMAYISMMWMQARRRNWRRRRRSLRRPNRLPQSCLRPVSSTGPYLFWRRQG